MGCNFSKEDCKTCSFILIITITIFALLLAFIVIDMSYESTSIEVGETELLPLSNDNGYPLFYGVEDRIHYFVQIRNGNMIEKILLLKHLTELKENSPKAVLKEYAIVRVPKDQFYDFLFVNNHSKIRWEICIP